MTFKQAINRMTSLILVVFMTAPIIAIVIFGPAKPYGHKPFSMLPKFSKLLSNSDNNRTKFIAAIIERSPIRRYALKSYYQFQYDFIRYVDTPRIVSGKDDWLYYKGQFLGGKCLPDRTFSIALHRIDMIQALAERAGLKVRFSVSPDKYSVYPEFVHPKAVGYVGCRGKNGERWRALAHELAPELVEHTSSLRLEKAARSTQDEASLLYYRTDTHWNTTVAPIIVDDIATAFGAKTNKLPTLSVVLGGKDSRTDLRNKMLLLDKLERVPARTMRLHQAPQHLSNILILHDSFYRKLKKQLTKALPGASFYHFGHGRKVFETLIETTTYPVLINSVERSFFARFRGPFMARISRTILRRNMARAQACKFVDDGLNNKKIITVNNATVNGNTYTAINRDPQIILRRNATAFDCLRVKLKLTKMGAFEVFLPNRIGRKRKANFEAGRSFTLKLAAGTHDLKFILPHGLQTPMIRIDPTNVKSRFEIIDLNFGLIEE